MTRPIVESRHLTQDLGEYRPSAISLIVANVVPLIGVLFFGWSTFAVVALYWSENVILGVINILKIITCSPDMGKVEDTLSASLKETSSEEAIEYQRNRMSGVHHTMKLFFVPFFTVHYGIFCLVHGVFVFVLLGSDGFLGGPAPSVTGVLDRFSQDQLWWGVAALFVSHMISFFTNYIGRGEYRRTVVPVLMFQPYVRVVLLHVAILIGAFATVALGSPMIIMLLLIAGKTYLDLQLHLRERKRNAGGEVEVTASADT